MHLDAQLFPCRGQEEDALRIGAAVQFTVRDDHDAKAPPRPDQAVGLGLENGFVRALESGPKRCATARKAVLRKGLPLLLEARSSLKLNLPRIGERGDVALVGLREEDGAECDDALVPRQPSMKADLPPANAG